MECIDLLPLVGRMCPRPVPVPLLDLIYEPFARWRLDRRADSCPIFFILLAVVVSFALSAYL